MATEVIYRETPLVLADLIQSELGLPKGVVALYNQKRTVPTKTGLWIDVAILGQHPFSATTRTVNDPTQIDLVGIQTVAQRELYQIDVMSYDGSARQSLVRITMAFSGIAAQQACEQNAMKLASIPLSFVDVSAVEGSQMLNRFAGTVAVIRSYSYTKTVPTFTSFEVPPRIHVNA